MNSSGWIRAMMAVNYDEEKFLKAVGDIIGKEFEKEVLILEILNGYKETIQKLLGRRQLWQPQFY